jgi:hypothetical protein
LALLYVNPGRLGDGAPRAVLEAAVPRVRREVLAVCDALAGPQRPAGLVLIPRAPSLEAGELTASLKVRRAAIEARYALGLQQVSRLLEGRAPAAIWVDDLEVLAGTL